MTMSRETIAAASGIALSERTAAQMRRKLQKTLDCLDAIRAFQTEPSRPTAPALYRASRATLLGIYSEAAASDPLARLFAVKEGAL